MSLYYLNPKVSSYGYTYKESYVLLDCLACRKSSISKKKIKLAHSQAAIWTFHPFDGLCTPFRNGLNTVYDVVSVGVDVIRNSKSMHQSVSDLLEN